MRETLKQTAKAVIGGTIGYAIASSVFFALGKKDTVSAGDLLFLLGAILLVRMALWECKPDGPQA